MNQCVRCNGFVPEGQRACPNCSTLVPKWKAVLAFPLAVAGAGVAAITLSACYGPACATKLSDGTVTGGGDICLDCTSKQSDGGLVGDDPNNFSECHPGQVQDAGTDGGTDGGP